MTKDSTLTFEVHSPSPSIIIPARKSSHISASITPSRMSPITGNPVLGNKLLTLPSQPSSKNSSPDLASLSSSPVASLNPITNKTNDLTNTSLVSSPRFPPYSSSYSSPSSTTHLLTNGFHSTTRLPDMISINESEHLETFPERPKRNTMKRSLSNSKESNSLHFTPTFVRNPFNDCEIFSLELSNSDESNSKI